MNVELVFKTAPGEWDSLLGRGTAWAETSTLDASFTELVERQSRFVFRIAYSVLRNVEDAEDVAQDTFLKLFRTGAWKNMEDEKAFLARMAWRMAVSRTQPKQIHPSESREEATADSSPEQAAIDTETSQTIHRLIDALPEKLRRPLALSAIEEMSMHQIAMVMDLPEGTIRRLVTEARALLKQKMARREGGKHA